jgi:hypothetical protein
MGVQEIERGVSWRAGADICGEEMTERITSAATWSQRAAMNVMTRLRLKFGCRKEVQEMLWWGDRELSARS